MLLLLPLLSCSDPPVSDSADSEPYEPGPVEPALTVDEVVAAVHARAAAGFLDPHAVMDLYLERLSHGDEGCPGDLQQLTDRVVYGCSADSGYWYMGVATYIEQDDSTLYYRELGGDFLIIDDVGQSFEVGAGMVVYLDRYSNAIWTVLMGTVTWDGSSGWMRSASAVMEGTLDPATEQGVLRLDGGLRVGDEVLDLRGARWDPLSCDDQVSGDVGWRGPDLRWYVADLECGCGPLSFEGQDLGEACIDLSGMAGTFRRALMDGIPS